MLKQKLFSGFRVMLIVFAATILTLQSIAQATGSKLSVQYINAPLFKGLQHNAAMRIRVYVPAGKEISYNSIQLNLDNEAFKAIDKLTVSVRADGSFSFIASVSVISSVMSSSNIMNVPFEITCKPGLNYV